MNCSECGYPKENHRWGAIGMGCYYEFEGVEYAHPTCRRSPQNIVIEHQQTRLTAAEKLITALTWGGRRNQLLTPDQREALDAWEATKGAK